jgi:ABC-type transport system involved in multi-copper enzyme maturation permease subunit
MVEYSPMTFPTINFAFLADASPSWLYDNIIPLVGVAIVVLGLAVFGLADLLRFSPKRIWAISSVCYQESIRRRVLWIIPLAILGLIIVVQLQQPIDEQDAIRQTTRFCLFATGMVVVISTIILACTNLPREIENRVIFTVVTKPTTRLEIILGKITGFARMSATILLIMVLFTFGYLNIRAWSLESDLRERLRLNAVESISRPTFQHYVDAGLLNAKRLAVADTINVYGQTPVAGSTRRYPSLDGRILIPFHIPSNMLAGSDSDAAANNPLGIRVSVRLGYDPKPPSSPAKGVKATPSGPPMVTVLVFDQNANTALGGELKGNTMVIPTTNGSQTTSFDIAPSNAASLLKFPYVYLVLSNGGGDGDYWIDEDPANPAVTLTIPVVGGDTVTVKPSDPTDPSKPGKFVYVGREGVIGMQIKGDTPQVGVYDFHNLDIARPANGLIPIEFRIGVEKSGDIRDEDVPTDATLTVVNTRTGAASDPVKVQPENNRPFYANISADSVAGGDFQVLVRCQSPDQWLNVKRSSLAIVQSDDSFALNLIKSGLIIWLLSILVTAISVFCSTFLSWPIAVVLTLVILLGHWGVNQLGDAATAGLGRQFVTDFGVTDPSAGLVLANSVEDLNKALKAVSTVLPDIEQFSATDDIDRGISIPPATLVNSLIVLVGFGLPMTVLAFIFLKNKEVAP